MPNQVPRRRFLALSAAATGISLFEMPRLLRANDDYGGFPLGVQSYSLRNFNTLEAVRHIQGMDLHYVEFYSKHLSLDASDEQIAETKKLLANADIAMSAHGVSSFGKDHDANRKVFAFAKRAGIRNITANPQRDAFDSLDKLCEEFQIRIAIHNHGPGAMFDKISDTVHAVNGRHPLIGACVDTGHYIRSGEDPVQAIHDLKGRVFGLHVKDDKYKGDKRSHNVVIGQANLDVVGIFKALKATKFPADGAISLEYESNPQNPIDDMKQCLAVAREAIAKVSKG